MKKKTAILILTIVASLHSLNSQADGVIRSILFAGPDDNNHANVVQIQIEGGFNVEGCDLTYAAIRVDETRKHLISFALTAYVSKIPVSVQLNPNDVYFGSRCTISRINSL